jgi:mandelate racemase
VPLLLIDLETEDGITGHSYLVGFLRRGCAYMAAVLQDIGERTKGRMAAPNELYDELTRGLILMGDQGIATMAIAGFDMACWDALAQAAGAPLCRLLGGTQRPIKAYNSNGLGLIGAEAAAEEAVALLAAGNFDAVKLRLGYETLAEDLKVVHAVRKAIGDDITLPCDYNQGLTVMDAVARGQALDSEGMYWIEEPIRYNDLDGNAKIAREVATPIQIGENFYGPRPMAEAISAEAADYMMPDVQKIGGVSAWLRAAALAHAASIEMSTHLFPEISSHLMTVTPTAHWLEYVNWASPILAEPLAIENGYAQIPDRPGTGVTWNEDAVKRFAMDL